MSKDAWTIAVKFRADGTINGPGNFAFDAEGTSWLLNNYTPPSDDPTVNAPGVGVSPVNVTEPLMNVLPAE